MGGATSQGSGDGTAETHGPALWALAGIVLYLIGAMLMLFVSLAIAAAVLGLLGIESGAGTMGLIVRNAAHPIGWGLFVAALAIPIGSRLVRGSGMAGWAGSCSRLGCRSPA